YDVVPRPVHLIRPGSRQRIRQRLDDRHLVGARHGALVVVIPEYSDVRDLVLDEHAGVLKNGLSGGGGGKTSALRAAEKRVRGGGGGGGGGGGEGRGGGAVVDRPTGRRATCRH